MPTIEELRERNAYRGRIAKALRDETMVDACDDMDAVLLLLAECIAERDEARLARDDFDRLWLETVQQRDEAEAERDAALRGEYTERLRVTLQAERQSHDDTIALLRELRAALKSIVGRIDSGFVYRSVDAAIEVLLKRAEGI